MAFDYCTVSQAFEYGNSAGTATDPVNEAAVMARIVTAVSRAIDGYCEQAFSLETYDLQHLRGVIDVDGALVAYPPVPTLQPPTAALMRFRVEGWSSEWVPLSLAGIEVFPSPAGAQVRFYERFIGVRHKRAEVKLSYVGGYASPSALPADLSWAAAALSWLTYQRRSAPMDVTAMPELGVVVNPGMWPHDIKQLLNRHKKVTPR